MSYGVGIGDGGAAFDEEPGRMNESVSPPRRVATFFATFRTTTVPRPKGEWWWWWCSLAARLTISHCSVFIIIIIFLHFFFFFPLLLLLLLLFIRRRSSNGTDQSSPVVRVSPPPIFSSAQTRHAPAVPGRGEFLGPTWFADETTDDRRPRR